MSFIEDVEYAVAKAVCFARGLDPASSAAADFVRYTYRDTTSPQPARSKNVCYITTSISGDPGLADYTQTGDTVTVVKTTPMEILLTYYGPNSADYADQMRTRMVVDTGYGCPLDIFRKANLALTVPVQVPTYAPELEDGNWRKRTDLRFTLTLTQTLTYELTNYADTAPEITIENS